MTRPGPPRPPRRFCADDILQGRVNLPDASDGRPGAILITIPDNLAHLL